MQALSFHFNSFKFLDYHHIVATLAGRQSGTNSELLGISLSENRRAGWHNSLSMVPVDNCRRTIATPVMAPRCRDGLPSQLCRLVSSDVLDYGLALQANTIGGQVVLQEQKKFS